MPEVVFHRRAWRAYQELPEEIALRMDIAIERLQQDPLKAGDVRKLRGQLAGLYRLRVGNWRIVFRLRPDENQIIIEDIGPRGSVY